MLVLFICLLSLYQSWCRSLILLNVGVSLESVFLAEVHFGDCVAFPLKNIWKQHFNILTLLLLWQGENGQSGSCFVQTMFVNWHGEVVPHMLTEICWWRVLGCSLLFHQNVEYMILMMVDRSDIVGYEDQIPSSSRIVGTDITTSTQLLPGPCTGVNSGVVLFCKQVYHGFYGSFEQLVNPAWRAYCALMFSVWFSFLFFFPCLVPFWFFFVLFSPIYLVSLSFPFSFQLTSSTKHKRESPTATSWSWWSQWWCYGNLVMTIHVDIECLWTWGLTGNVVQTSPLFCNCWNCFSAFLFPVGFYDYGSKMSLILKTGWLGDSILFRVNWIHQEGDSPHTIFPTCVCAGSPYQCWQSKLSFNNGSDMILPIFVCAGSFWYVGCAK